MPPDEPTKEEQLEELPNDFDTPFSIPDDGGDPTHPQTDTNVELNELYQEGINGGGRETTAPDDNDVAAYDPDKDKSNNEAA